MHFQHMLSANRRRTCVKLRSFISKSQVLNAYLKEFPPDTEGQDTAPLPVNEIMDIPCPLHEKQDD